MEVRCDQCQARYRVDDARVGPKGLAMRCGKCGNIFRLLPDGTITRPAAAKASSIPTPGTATPLATTPSAPRTAALPGGEGRGGTAVFEPTLRPKPEPVAKASALQTPAAEVAPAIPAAPPRENVAERPAVAPVRPQRPPRSMQLADVPASGPPRALVVGVGIALAGLAIIVGVFVFWNKHRPPPSAAVELVSRAKIAADKDSLLALADAESQATAAIEAAPRGYPAAYAALAEIEVAWADALDDEAYFSSDRAERAGRAGDDATKLEADGRAAAFQDQAKGRLRQAFEAAMAGNRLDPKSPGEAARVALALADYRRATGSRTNMTLELKRAVSLGGDPAHIAFVQGADLLGQEDGAAQAIDRLEEAVKGAPTSARYRFRLSLAYLKAQRTGEAQKALQETLRLSPSHERAKLVLETLASRSETRDGKTR